MGRAGGLFTRAYSTKTIRTRLDPKMPMSNPTMSQAMDSVERAMQAGFDHAKANPIGPLTEQQIQFLRRAFGLDTLEKSL